MTKINELIFELEQEVPVSYQESWDNSGLIIGDESQEISSVLLTVDVTEDVVEEAILKGANIIIAHHPIIFKGLKTLTGKDYVERTVIKALKNDIAIYAMHTNLDVVPFGVSYKMAEKLNLSHLKTLDIASNNYKKIVCFVPKNNAEAVREALFLAGAGRIGDYDKCSFNTEGTGTFRGLENSKAFVGKKGELHQEQEVRIESIFPAHLKNQIREALVKTHPYEEPAYDILTLDQAENNIGLGQVGELPKAMDEKEFLLHLKKTFGLQNLRYSPLLGKPIKTVAVCGGSCSFLTKKAKKLADIIVTADVKYHEFFDAEKDIIIADIGHYESEQYSKEIFYDIISKKFSNFAVHFSEVNTNPINYL